MHENINFHVIKIYIVTKNMIYIKYMIVFSIANYAFMYNKCCMYPWDGFIQVCRFIITIIMKLILQWLNFQASKQLKDARSVHMQHTKSKLY